MVYIGPWETEETCARWKKQYELPFPVVPDLDGVVFEELSNGWVPCTILVGRDGSVLFSENQFDEHGYLDAIERLFAAPVAPEAEAAPSWSERADRDRGANVVILGAGTGGLVAAHQLRSRLPAKHRVTVIDRTHEYLFEPSLLWMMVGKRNRDQIHRSRNTLRKRGIDFHEGEVTHIDLPARQVHTAAGVVDFDFLVVALGAQTKPESVAGFGEMALDLYSADGCARIESELESWEGGRIAVLVTDMPFKCPAAPYEAALLLEAHCRQRGVREQTEIHLYTPEHQAMGVAGDHLGKAIGDMLGTRGILYHPLFPFESLRPESGEIVAGDGQVGQVDLLIAVPPHEAPEVVREAGLTGVSGWIHVHAATLETGQSGVYAIGDITTIRLPNSKSLPKAGVFAHAQAKVVARRIADEVQDRVPRAEFDGHGYCFVELGDGQAAFANGQFYAEPGPEVGMWRPGRLWHWGKVAFEAWWLRYWF